jgi:hypothetical protein
LGDDNEQVTVAFINYTEIFDIQHNNSLSSQPATSYLNPYTYISPGAASAIDGGGTSLKYALISVFGF